MSIYARYKKDQDGFRRLVELLESTPLKRRQELIDRGMKEDEAYSKAAVGFIITFQDVLQLREMELAEVIAAMKAKNVAFCVLKEEETVKKKFLAAVQKSRVLEVHSYLDSNPSAAEIGGAKKEAIQMARKLESNGLISLKKIPKNFTVKPSSKSRSTEESTFSDDKGLFGDGLFGSDEDIIGVKKKAS